MGPGVTCAGGSGGHLGGGAAGAEHGVEMLDEDLGEDVDGGQRRQRDGAVTRPQQVHAEHAGQVGRTHLVLDAPLGHLGGDGHTERGRGRQRDTFSAQTNHF